MAHESFEPARRDLFAAHAVRAYALAPDVAEYGRYEAERLALLAEHGAAAYHRADPPVL